MSTKLKVVWICHFSNEEVQQSLKTWSKINEHSPWITNMLKLFENDETIELHVIAPQEYLSFSKTYENKGIHFHFIRKGIPLIGRRWPRFFMFDLWTNYRFWKSKTKKIITKINPDIIHLHGFENEFCGAIFQFKKKYPVFITIQGFVNFSSANTHKLNFRKKQEVTIIKSFRHFGIRTEKMGNDLKKFNKNVELHRHQFPLKKIRPLNLEKKYDLVFFARMTKDKGIVDLIKALDILKRTFPKIKLCVIGGGKKESFQALAKELNVNHLIDWVGFLPTQEDVHKMASLAKLSILPTYNDNIPGTIIESLFLKVPVVAYDVGSIHELNKNIKVVSLVEKKDIEALANEITFLLNRPDIMEERKISGLNVVAEMFGENNLQIKNEFVNIYKKVFQDFKKN